MIKPVANRFIMSYNRSMAYLLYYADSSPSYHDDSRRLIKPTAGTEFTRNHPSAALPFVLLLRIGYPLQELLFSVAPLPIIYNITLYLFCQ